MAPSFDEFEGERIYTFGIERGGWDALTVRVEGCAVQHVARVKSADAKRGRDVALKVCSDAKRPLRIELSGTLQLPGRYGTLGVARDTMTLGDPWYPLLLQSSDAAVPPAADHVVHVAPIDERIVATAAGAVTTDGAHPVAAVEQYNATHAPVVVLPTSKSYAHERAAGVDLYFVTDRAPLDVRHLYPVEGHEPPDQGDHWDVDAAGVIQGTILDCIALLRRLGFTMADRPRPRGMSASVVVVEIPERQRLAVDVPGMLLVSDHAFRLSPPWDKTRRYHGRPVARRAFAALIVPHLLATSAREDSPWVGDVDGTFLTDLLIIASDPRYRDSFEQLSTPKDENAKALVSTFAFHPAIDQLLYAPRVAFGSALFGALEEPDPDRHGGDRARNEIPFGQFHAEKLRNRFADKTADVVKKHLLEGHDWRAAAAAISDHDLGYFWKQWIGPHRKLAYRIAGVQTEELTTRVTVERLGDTWIREPVVVEVIDRSGNHLRKTWDAPGPRTTLEFVTVDRYQEAKVDPDMRIAEDPSLVDGHPRFDNETSHAWRPPVFSALGATWAATERRLDFEFNFAVRRRFDVDRGWGFAGNRSARGYYGAIRWFENFGGLRDLNNRYATWSAGLAFQRSPFGFAGEPNGVTEVLSMFSIGWDTRVMLQDPRSGTAGLLYLWPSLSRVDGGQYRGHVTLGARYVHLFFEHLRSTTAVMLTGATVLGPAFEPQLLGVAERNQLRGFEADEFLTRTRAELIVEQRLKVLSGQFFNVLNASWLKSLEIVPFGAIAAISRKESAFDFRGRGHFVAELGLGVRFFHEYFGVQPGLIAVDFAVPFFRADTCVRRGQVTSGGFSYRDYGPGDPNDCVRQRQPFGLYVSAEQTF